MGRVYAVASGKGGVGKTTTTVNLGAALAAAGHEVAVVDADLGMANVAGAFDVDPAAATVHDVLAGEADVADATYEGAGGVSVIPGSDDVTAFARSDPEGLDDLVDALSEYDFVLLDTGASLTHVTVRPLAIADEVLLVSTTERAALGDTDRTRQVTNRVGGSVVGAVLTRVDPAKPNAEEVTATLDAKVLEVVPEDSAVGGAMAAGAPLEVHAPRSQAAAAYRRLAALLSGDADPTRESAASEADSEFESETETETDADPAETEASAGPDDGSTDAGETGGLSDVLASAETEADADADEAEAAASDGSDDAPTADDDSREAEAPDDEAPAAVGPGASDAPETSDAGASTADRDGTTEMVDGTDADEATGEDETADGEAAESTVSETVLADESARGLVEEAEPGDVDDSRTYEGRTDDAESSAGGLAGVPDAESSTDAADDRNAENDEEDGDDKGFFRRLLG